MDVDLTTRPRLADLQRLGGPAEADRSSDRVSARGEDKEAARHVARCIRRPRGLRCGVH